MARFALAVAVGVLAWVQAVPAWSQAGEPEPRFWRKVPGPARYYHTATLLPTGKVLVAGGCEPAPPGAPACATATDKVEIFDPATLTWSPVAKMTVPRTGHTAAVLADGDVLVVGGCSGLSPQGICTFADTNNAERYDAATGTWARVGGFENTLVGVFRGQTATVQPDGPVSVCGATCGKVLVIGTVVSLIWDPATATSVPTAKLKVPHEGYFLPLINHSATRLPDGRLVVVSVGFTTVYDPRSDSWAPGAAPSDRDQFSSNLLGPSQVLVTGGIDENGVPAPFPEFYDADAGEDPASKGAWRPLERPAVTRFGHAAVEVGDGEVLVVGGRDAKGDVVPTAEVYQAGTGRWGPAGAMTRPRGASPLVDLAPMAKAASLTATVLQDGRILAVGGDVEQAADLYGPLAAAPKSTPTAGGDGRGGGRWWALGAVPAAVLVAAVVRWSMRRPRRRA